MKLVDRLLFEGLWIARALTVVAFVAYLVVPKVWPTFNVDQFELGSIVLSCLAVTFVFGRLRMTSSDSGIDLKQPNQRIGFVLCLAGVAVLVCVALMENAAGAGGQ